ncbi:MAG TPA: 30S ribosomal protein S12 methylthiotransferase RimO [Myxococcales bacterium]|nr:30S ribosomal protein S12 methylthiotransferase RimO [Myxococcales bacterium]
MESGTQKTLYLLSLGCPKNRVDSEVMLGSLLDEGYRVVEEPEKAEVILINSCAFIGEAKQESIDAILEHARLKEAGSCKALVVAGCLTQRYADVLQQEMPEVDYFVGTSAYPRIAQILKGERDRAVIPDPDYIADSKTPRRNSMPAFTAYVKISEGCDNKCTFCIIPTLRGLQRSRPINDIVAEAHQLVAQGAVELNLVAQDLTAYGYDLPGKPRLHDLLHALREVPARWIRLHYAYPRDFPEPLIDALAAQPNLARYLDMPLQHIADPVLRRMKRGRAAAWVRRLVKRIRERVPDLTFRTSFIVGFPGETDEQFSELCDFVDEMRFEKVGVFQFSREEGTPSYDLDGQLPQRTKASRQKKLLGIQRKISKAHQQAMVGRTLDVLVEGVSGETELLLEGRWMGQAPEIDGKVYINRGQARAGEIVKVEIEQAGDYDLVGGIVGCKEPAGLAGGRAEAGGRSIGGGPARQLGAQPPLMPRPRFPILSH